MAKAEYHHAIRRLQLSGAAMREIAAALNLSHQRVQQIVDGQGGGRRWRRRTPDTPEMLVCSFCATDQRQANKLVAGPGVYICQRCVEVAREIAHGGQPATPAARLVAVGRRHATRCGFCGKDRAKVKHLITTEADHAPVPRQAKSGIVSIATSVLTSAPTSSSNHTGANPRRNAHKSLSSVSGPPQQGATPARAKAR